MANLKGHMAAGSPGGLIGIHINIGIPICLRRSAGTHPKEAETMQTTYGEQHQHRHNPFAWAALVIVVIAVIAFLAVIAFHAYTSGPMPYYYGYPGFGWWFFPLGLFFGLLFLFFIFRVLFWGWGWGGGWGWRRRYWYGYYGDASEVLRQRYARGEITKEQFDQMKRDLEQR